MLDLAARSVQQPRFWVAIRYGGGDEIVDPALSSLPFKVRSTERAVENGEVVATWGSRDPGADYLGYRGDEFFDYYARGEIPPTFMADQPPWRPVGSDGLILFHVNQVKGQAHPAVAVGVCIPLGGPDQFAAVVSSADPGRAA